MICSSRGAKRCKMKRKTVYQATSSTHSITNSGKSKEHIPINFPDPDVDDKRH